MVLVDSSVWIDFFSGRPSRQGDLLEQLFAHRLVLTGDLILTEVLQGFRRRQDYRRAFAALGTVEFRPLVGKQVALAAVDHNRVLRENEVTVRKTIDLLIATFCVLHDCDLLHSDRDYDLMAPHIGLRTL